MRGVGSVIDELGGAWKLMGEKREGPAISVETMNDTRVNSQRMSYAAGQTWVCTVNPRASHPPHPRAADSRLVADKHVTTEV